MRSQRVDNTYSMCLLGVFAGAPSDILHVQSVPATKESICLTHAIAADIWGGAI